MSSSVEDMTRSSVENLIKELRKELQKERDVSSKERSVRMDLMNQLTEYETQKQRRLMEIKDLRNTIAVMHSRIHELTNTIQRLMMKENKDSDKMSDTDIKEEGAYQEEVNDEVTTKIITNGDGSNSGGTDAAAITITENSSETRVVLMDEEKKESESGGPELDKLSINESRRFLIKVRTILRQIIRDKFGIIYSNRCGHWLDRHMSHLVWKYGYWLDYPDGHHILRGHSDAVLAAAVSTDGRFLFTAGKGGNLIVWDLLDYSMLKQFDTFDTFIICLIYECDLLVSGSEDKKIRILNGITHDLIRIIEAHSDVVCSLQLNRECTQIVSASRDQSVRVWCTKTGDCLARLTGHTGHVISAYFMDDDTRVMSGSGDSSIKVWSVNNLTGWDSITYGVRGRIYDMSVNCDSSWVACCFFCRGLFIYNWPNMDIMRRVKMKAWKCQFHPLNPDILAVFNLRLVSVEIYNVRSGDKIAEWLDHGRPVTGLYWSRDGYRLVSISEDKSVRVWDCTSLIE